MPFTDPATRTTGELITASIWNTDVVANTEYLNQSVDQVNAELDLLQTSLDNPWSSYTPTLTQSGTLSKTVNYAKYKRIGRTIFATVDLSITSGGASGVAIEIGLPVTAAAAGGVVGVFRYFDSGSTIYAGTALASTTSVVQCFVSGNGNPMGINPAFGAANGDSIQMHVTYEAATA
jgi:hypothetical protein